MSNRIRILLPLLGAMLVVGSAGCKPNQDESGQQIIRVTGIPDENPTELQRKSQPLVDYLEEKLGRKVEYLPVTDYGAAVQALAAEKADFAWLGGFTFVQAKRMAGVEPLCMRDIDREFKSVIVTKVGSGISSIDDVKGKSFAFGSRSSTSGHLMPRHFLARDAKIDAEKDFSKAPVYSGAHDATVLMVQEGAVDAGATSAEVWERMVKNKQVDTEKVHAIWTSDPYVDYVWGARSTLDPEIKAKFKAAFLDLDPSIPQHKAVLDLQGANKFVPANADDFDTVEEVGLSTGLLK